jgi:hypothetical protein
MHREQLHINSEINRNYNFNLKELIEERFPGKHVTITSSARKALDLILNYERRNGMPNSVYIETTSSNLYISGCVTRTIDAMDDWSRDIHENQNLQLFNHEFGYVDNCVKREKSGKKLIEDCAYAFNSKFEDGELAGSLGDYAILSLSKFFPIQIGGVLLSNEAIPNNEKAEDINYISNVVGYYWDKIEYWSEKRLCLFEYYKKVFSTFGCKPFFKSSKNNIPGVFLFNLPNGIDQNKLKEFYWKKGVQCSAFYGTNAFYLPLNQTISERDVDYFGDLYKTFLSRNDQ